MENLAGLDWKTLFFSFEGRISRKTYWIGTIAIVGLMVIVSIIGGILGAIFAPLSLVVSLASLALCYPAVAVSAKRWHDRNKSGWWSLVNLIPLGFLYALYELGIAPATDANNQFGADPLVTA